MKKPFYLIVFLLIASLSTLYSQKDRNWRWQNPLPQGNTLHSSATIGNNIVFFAGDAGTILKSKDGGQTFTRQKTFTRENLYSIFFIGTRCGMAVGTNGTILKTTDCGNTWKKLSSGRKDTLRGISLLSSQSAIAVGDTGTILRTRDGGDTWVYDPLPGFKPNLNGISFPTPDFGVIVGDSFPPFGGPPIIVSEDSGDTFNPYGPGNPSLAGININSVFVPEKDPDKAVLVGDKGVIVSTTTKGTTWSTPISNVTVDISNVWFFDGDNGFATGPNGTILRTKDCGDTWSLIISPIKRDLNTVIFPKNDTLNGFFGGAHGIIYRTLDGGLTVDPIGTGFRPNLTAVTFLDDSFGIATGHQGAILRTENAGNDWLPVQTGLNFDWESLQFEPTKRRLWLAGGIFGDSARIAFSDDDGLNWTPQPIPSPVKLFDIAFSDSLNGTAVGPSGWLWVTKDGGKNWFLKFTGITDWFLSTAMPSDTTTFVVGGNGTILRSVDGGNTFVAVASGTSEWLTHVSFLDDSVGMACGNHGVVLRTRDRGNTWEDVSPVPNITFDFTGLSLFRGLGVSNRSSKDAFSVTLVGQNGIILNSDDSGDTWTQDNSQTNCPIADCFFTDSLTGTVVGAFGMILRTDSRGVRVGIEDGLEQTFPVPQLGQNYPNPATGITQIPFTLPFSTIAQLTVYDLNGREVARLVDQPLPRGVHRYAWDTQGLTPGMYIYRLDAGGQVMSKKMMVEE